MSSPGELKDYKSNCISQQQYLRSDYFKPLPDREQHHEELHERFLSASPIFVEIQQTESLFSTKSVPTSQRWS